MEENELKEKIKFNKTEKKQIGLRIIGIIVILLGLIILKRIEYITILIIWLDLLIKEYFHIKQNKQHDIIHEKQQEIIKIQKEIIAILEDK